MNKDELIDLVRKIKAGAFITEEAEDEAVELLERNVPDPNVSNLIYWDDLTAEEVVERALSYKPIQL